MRRQRPQLVRAHGRESERVAVRVGRRGSELDAVVADELHSPRSTGDQGPLVGDAVDGRQRRLLLGSAGAKRRELSVRT